MELLDVDLAQIDDVCRRYGIRRLEVFGSTARGEAHPNSDVDLLYELQPGRSLGWEIEDLTHELSTVFGRSVDLVSHASLHPVIRGQVLGEATLFYEAA